MKGFNIFLVILAVVFSCNAQTNQSENKLKTANEPLISFGDKIDSNNILTTDEVLERYQGMAATDTLQTKFTARVKEVCKVKGCWMILELTNGEEAMVRFKDYGFFMPTDINDKEVIVGGFAYVEEMSVADQKHFAEDGGMSKEQIDAISKPKMTYGFEANGVLVKQ
ncbi:DUF4920 domain-containing protein [Maribacter aestuarii]|uniref:DUF4920 domain-containing protein n=1 Tax=Maribacter aestuarii TaxID=1130723 RepID=UPI00248C2F22|nr:DUF4920 domain-containing protein [Maribacter aestuarii]